uniref:Uncharacterized protein n=1 Tax=Onchocerca volvulus TaxID=6282 RepID=A0A8R1TUY6_ONCVO
MTSQNSEPPGTGKVPPHTTWDSRPNSLTFGGTGYWQELKAAFSSLTDGSQSYEIDIPLSATRAARVTTIDKTII